jgi:hypothetical protein
MGAGAYTFGDSALAVARLALLAELFADSTTAFLRRFSGTRVVWWSISVAVRASPRNCSETFSLWIEQIG